MQPCLWVNAAPEPLYTMPHRSKYDFGELAPLTGQWGKHSADAMISSRKVHDYKNVLNQSNRGRLKCCCSNQMQTKEFE